MIARTAALRELTRFFRSRDAAWIVGATGVLLVVPMVVLVSALQGVEWDAEMRDVITTAGIVRNISALAELLGIVILAQFLAHRALKDEIDSGSWVLVRLTPASPRRIVAGKALGVAAVIWIVHSVAFSFLMLYTPFLRRTHAEVWVPFLAVGLYAVTLVPQGFATALIPRADRRRLELAHLATAVRLAFPLLLLQPMVLPAEGGGYRNVLDALVSWMAEQLGTVTYEPTPFFAHPSIPWAVILAWQIVSGWLIWHFLVLRKIS